MKINVADRASCRISRRNPGTDLQDHHTGSVELCLVDALRGARVPGCPPRHRAAIGVRSSTARIPTTIDKGLAPEASTCSRCSSQWVPHEWNEGAASRGAGGLRRPRDRRLHRAGAELPRRGDRPPGDRALRHGAGARPDRRQHLPRRTHVDQLFHMRPSPGFSDYRTPIPGLYHGSSATHAGGGVNGIPGWQAFRAARDDQRAPPRPALTVSVPRRPSRPGRTGAGTRRTRPAAPPST